jgi:hypothetical protein
MSFRCKGPNNILQNVNWKKIKDAWLPAITVCNQGFYVPEREPVVILPEVTTDDFSMFGLTGHVTGTVVSEGSSDVIEYGFVYSTVDPPTLDDEVVVVGSESFTGEFTGDTGYVLDNGVEYFFRAYATNSQGTSYGESFNGTAFICFIQGTQITLSNGSQKSIEDIDYEDHLLVWNFDEGRFDEAQPVWIAKEFFMPSYRMMKFNDGSELGTIDGIEGHAIFNMQCSKFTYLNSDETPIHTTTFNQQQEEIELVGSETIKDKIGFYNIITNSHINLFANGILTSSKLNNLYPINDMKFVKDQRSMRSRNEFDVSDDLFYGLRLNEQPKGYPKLKEKMATIVKNQAVPSFV